MKKTLLFSILLCFFSVLQLSAQQKPNVLILYTDDLGYGDLSCYGATVISTLHIYWLAQNGLRFTDAHSFLIYEHSVRSLSRFIYYYNNPFIGNISRL